MARKRRHTAKTGDRGIYKARRKEPPTKRPDEADDDAMYDPVDRFHQARDEEFLKLDGAANQDSSDDDETEQAVMDLALGGDSSSSESSSSEEEDGRKVPGRKMGADWDRSDDEEEEVGYSSSDDSNDQEQEVPDIRDWGGRKTAYYHGDTADLEIGQQEDDAFLEEEAAKEVQKARYEDMSEEDFVLSDIHEQDNTKEGEVDETDKLASSARDVSKLSKKDKRKLLDNLHPELLPLLTHFESVVDDLNCQTSPVVELLFEGQDRATEEVGSTKLGQQFLLSKALLQSSTALNTAIYLLLKSEQSEQDYVDASLIQSHPVLSRLHQWDKLSQKLEDGVENKVDGLHKELGNLVKVAALMKNGQIGHEDGEVESADGHSEGEESDQDSRKPAAIDKINGPPVASVGKDDNANIHTVAGGEEQTRSNIRHEARFGLRLHDMMEEAGAQGPAKRRRRVPSGLGDGFGDEDDMSASTGAAKTLASTVNAIQQRSNTVAARRAKSVPEEEADRDEDDVGDSLRPGIEMMEAEMGKLDDNGEFGDIDDGDGEQDEEGDYEKDSFYARARAKAKSKKDMKKSLYRVAPKYPRVETFVEGERAISKKILKNRGLVPHKSVLNRNPRVKKREQYRKALIRRKGAVREIRTDEGHKYGGEETGIKSSISRSRKLN